MGRPAAQRAARVAGRRVAGRAERAAAVDRAGGASVLARRGKGRRGGCRRRRRHERAAGRRRPCLGRRAQTATATRRGTEIGTAAHTLVGGAHGPLAPRHVRDGHSRHRGRRRGPGCDGDPARRAPDCLLWPFLQRRRRTTPPPPPPPRGRCRTAHCGTVAPAAASLPAPPCNPLVQLVVRTRAAGMCRQSANGTGLYHCAVLAQRLAVTVPITSSLFSPHPPHPLPEPSLWLSL